MEDPISKILGPLSGIGTAVAKAIGQSAEEQRRKYSIVLNELNDRYSALVGAFESANNPAQEPLKPVLISTRDEAIFYGILGEIRAIDDGIGTFADQLVHDIKYMKDPSWDGGLSTRRDGLRTSADVLSAWTYIYNLLYGEAQTSP